MLNSVMAKYYSSDQVAWNLIGDRVVALSLGKERQIHEFSEVASEIWKLLENCHDFDDLLANILMNFEVDEERAREDLEHFLQDLEGKGLIEIRSN